MNLFNKLSKWMKMKIDSYSDHEKHSNLLEYKILVLGERSVGKSSVCTRFTMNEFNLEIKPTTQSECYTKIVKMGEQVIKIYLVDVDDYVLSNDRSPLYADAKGALIVYDVTKSKTFDRVENWILDLRQNSSLNIPIIIVGNKSDLNFLKNVDYEEGLEKANNLNCEYAETTCVDVESVKEAFKLLIAKIYYNDLSDSKKNYFKIYFNSELSDKEKEKKEEGEEEEVVENDK
jgi:small GTP-binding protein